MKNYFKDINSLTKIILRGASNEINLNECYEQCQKLKHENLIALNNAIKKIEEHSRKITERQ